MDPVDGLISLLTPSRSMYICTPVFNPFCRSLLPRCGESYTDTKENGDAQADMQGVVIAISSPRLIQPLSVSHANLLHTCQVCLT